MRNNLRFFIAVFLVTNTLVFSQEEVTGFVYDAFTSEPLIGASIYYEGTTIGVVTDQNGFFTIRASQNSTSPLVIAYLGYKDEMVQPSSKPLAIYLTEQTESLDEVLIDSNSLFTRGQLLKVFREQFLGTTRAGQQSNIVNEDAINLYYDKNKNQLTASSDETLLIKNDYLGYEIKYKLYDFTIQYYRKTIYDLDIKNSYYAGTSFFIDNSLSKKKFLKRREKEYLGSSLQLMRVIANEHWDESDFVFYKKSFPVLPSNHIVVKDTLNLKKVTLLDPLNILYKKKEQSKIQTKYTAFYIDGYGNSYPPDAVLYGGDMGKKRMGNTLPIDFKVD